MSVDIIREGRKRLNSNRTRTRGDESEIVIFVVVPFISQRIREGRNWFQQVDATDVFVLSYHLCGCRLLC